MSKQANLLWNFSTVNNFLHLQFIFLYLLFQYSILEDLLKTFLFLISSLETSQPTCSTIFNFYLKIKHLYCHMPRSNSKTELKCRSDPDTSPLPSLPIDYSVALPWNGSSELRMDFRMSDVPFCQPHMASTFHFLERSGNILCLPHLLQSLRHAATELFSSLSGQCPQWHVVMTCRLCHY